MLPPRPSPLRHSHPCLSPTYTRSAFEGGFEVLRPSVRGTPSPTTHSEGLLLRVGALHCAPTYSRGVVQHVRGLQSFGACTATRMQLESRNVPCKQYYCASGLQRHIIICTEGVTAARRTLQRKGCRHFLGTRPCLPRRATLERVPTDWYFLFSACGVDMRPPRPSPLQLHMRWEFKPFSKKRFLMCARDQKKLIF